MPNRKYEVTLPNGKVVSRQRAHQIKYPERYKKYQKKYRDENKDRAYETTKLWREKFKEEHGISYGRWLRLMEKKNATTTSVEE